jgi:hypothetical protein
MFGLKVRQTPKSLRAMLTGCSVTTLSDHMTNNATPFKNERRRVTRVARRIYKLCLAWVREMSQRAALCIAKGNEQLSFYGEGEVQKL